LVSNPEDKRRGAVQSPPMSEGVSYGTISAEVVTHGLILLDWSRFPEEYTSVTTS
jgi:hypothetical protein